LIVSMPEADAEVVPLEVLPATPPRGHPVVAWAVILAVVVAVLWENAHGEAGLAVAAAARAGLLNEQLVARVLLGQRALQRNLQPASGRLDPSLERQMEALNTGPVAQRFRYAVLVGEMKGADAARTALRDLVRSADRAGVELSPDEQRVRDLLTQLYRAPPYGDAPALTPEDEAFLRRHLGWFGELAVPATHDAALAAATRTFWVVIGGMVGAGGLTLFGLVGLVVTLILFAGGSLRGGLCGPSFVGGVYAEAFAVWMLVYGGFMLAARFIPVPAPLRLLLSGAGMLVTLAVALAWPVARGVSWRQVRRDIGWVPGRGVAVEVLWGLGSYVMALPLVAVGLGITLLLMNLHTRLGDAGARRLSFSPDQGPSHPIGPILMQGDWGTVLQVLLLASVLAPFVEETMFRGFLYRHLRDASARLGGAVSVLLSAAAVSFVFAVIHPQGWLGVPVLMTLALSFALVREWRRSLAASMTMHALNNTLAVLFVTLATRG
jgi:membrane protease YdiL (CAAX protease family)